MAVAVIPLGIVYGEVHASDAPARGQRADERSELAVVEAGTAGGIDRGHHLLVQDVEVDVHPRAIEVPRLEPRENTARARVDALGQHFLHIESGDLGRENVAVEFLEPRLARATL